MPGHRTAAGQRRRSWFGTFTPLAVALSVLVTLVTGAGAAAATAGSSVIPVNLGGTPANGYPRADGKSYTGDGRPRSDS